MTVHRLAAPAAVLACVLAAAACGSPTPTGSAKPPADRVLRLSFLKDPGQPPDPDVFYAGQGLLLTDNLYEGLLRYRTGGANPRITGLLATSWKESADHREITLKLRKGVKFHDGTPFTADAVKASFDRRLAVDQGPAYMVKDVASVTGEGDHEVVIRLKKPNAVFLSYLASPYGPRMMSPTALKEHAGSDDAQTYLRTHDIGTGAYTLSDAKVGAHYGLKAFPDYWGHKPYFTSVDLPVLNDDSTQQLKFNNGQLAAILHDLSTSAVQSYRKNTAVRSYSLPTMQSLFLYVNPRLSFLTSQAGRWALFQAINAKAVAAPFAGRGTRSLQAYPPNMIADGKATQDVPYNTAALRNLARTLPAGQKSITIGYDSQSSDLQLIANLIAAQLSPLGITAKVQGYPTSQIFGWPGHPKGSPELLVAGGWPDASPPYTWAHINWDPDGGLNYLNCSVPGITRLLPKGEATGADQIFDQVGHLATQSGCWYNLVDLDDFMVTQPWLKGVPQSHSVAAPFTLKLADLSAG